MRTLRFDVTVIGSGPGGYVAAIRAAQLGKRVAIVEREQLGGVCLNWGCIPTKALLRSAERFEFLKESASWGFGIGELSVDWTRVIARSREAAEKLSRGVAFLLKKNRVEVIRGTGRFATAHRILVEGGPEPVEIETTHTVLATGARATVLPGIALSDPSAGAPRVITSREGITLETRPESMTVIGGGAIGLELAYLYSAFGTRVTVLEFASRLLPAADEEISAALEKSFTRRGITVRTGARVAGVEETSAGTRTRFERDGKTETVESDVALVAVGVRANIDGLGLEKIGVVVERGAVRVDEHLRTSVETIYAIGDVNGPPALAHVASAEGLHAASHLAEHGPLEPLDRDCIPACVYTQPQVAQVGLTESEARERGHEIRVGRFPYQANGKAVAVGETEGFSKLITDAQTGEILGAHILGADATELIAELALARRTELTIEDIHGTVHAHPTLSETVLEAAADALGEAVQH